MTPELYRLVDDLCTQYGQNDLRATTRQCFQIHGIMKGNLKTVISSIMNIGSSTVGVSESAWRAGMTARRWAAPCHDLSMPCHHTPGPIGRWEMGLVID